MPSIISQLRTWNRDSLARAQEDEQEEGCGFSMGNEGDTQDRCGFPRLSRGEEEGTTGERCGSFSRECGEEGEGQTCGVDFPRLSLEEEERCASFSTFKFSGAETAQSTFTTMTSTVLLHQKTHKDSGPKTAVMRDDPPAARRGHARKKGGSGEVVVDCRVKKLTATPSKEKVKKSKSLFGRTISFWTGERPLCVSPSNHSPVNVAPDSSPSHTPPDLEPLGPSRVFSRPIPPLPLPPSHTHTHQQATTRSMSSSQNDECRSSPLSGETNEHKTSFTRSPAHTRNLTTFFRLGRSPSLFETSLVPPAHPVARTPSSSFLAPPIALPFRSPLPPPPVALPTSQTSINSTDHTRQNVSLTSMRLSPFMSSRGQRTSDRASSVFAGFYGDTRGAPESGARGTRPASPVATGVHRSPALGSAVRAIPSSPLLAAARNRSLQESPSSSPSFAPRGPLAARGFPSFAPTTAARGRPSSSPQAFASALPESPPVRPQRVDLTTRRPVARPVYPTPARQLPVQEGSDDEGERMANWAC